MKSFKSYLTEEQLNEVLITFGNRPNFGQVILLAGGAGCFDGNTLVQTDVGLKPIKEIKENDSVKSYNEITKEYEYKPVEAVYQHAPQKEMIELILDTGESIICTEDHEFLVDGKYIQAKKLLGKELTNDNNIKK